MGVHKPTSSSIPAAIARTWNIARLTGGPLRSSMILRTINAMPTTSRISRSPTPGAPCANVEKSRRKIHRGYVIPDALGKLKKVGAVHSFE